MLLGEQSEVRQPRDVVTGCPNAEEAAFFFGGFRAHRGTQCTGAGSDGRTSARRRARRIQMRATSPATISNRIVLPASTGNREASVTGPIATVAVQSTPSLAIEAPTARHTPATGARASAAGRR